MMTSAICFFGWRRAVMEHSYIVVHPTNDEHHCQKIPAWQIIKHDNLQCSKMQHATGEKHVMKIPKKHVTTTAMNSSIQNKCKEFSKNRISSPKYTDWLTIFCALSLQNIPVTGHIRFTNLSHQMMDADAIGVCGSSGLFQDCGG